jgi:phytoene dehydrogenase-like protein
MHARWQEVFDIGKLTFVDAAEYQRIETEHGESLSIYTNVDRMETELLKQAPQDAVEVRRFAAAVRGFTRFNLPYLDEPWPRKWLALLSTLRHSPALRHWASMTVEEYSARFTHPLLRSFFKGDLIGIGAAVTRRPLPHHRAYGSVHGGSSRLR